MPVINWIKGNHKIDYVDMITEPGMDGCLVDERYSIENILKKIDISVKKHGSGQVFVVGHHDCAGNPVDQGTHSKQIVQAVERVKYLRHLVNIVGLWVTDKWLVEKVVEK
ncbi:MAG: carbonic anhydrase [Thermodesulfovibrionales bacterium]